MIILNNINNNYNNLILNKIEYINNLKNEEFEKFNIIEIIKITKTLGIPTPKKENKIELLKRIKKYIDGYQNQILVPKYNKFNSTIKDLAIKDNLEIGEKLFWMVFKNKYLFKSITHFLNIGSHSTFESNFGFGKQYFKYDEINDVKFMLDNNYLFMLKEKVHNGEILVFTNSNNSGRYISPSSSPPISSCSSISNKKEKVVDFFQEIIKRVKEEKHQLHSLDSFYKSLFENYSKYIISYDSLATFILNQNNISALKALVYYQPNNYQLSQITLLGAIQNSFFKGVKFIVDHLKNQNYNILPIKYSCLSNIKTKNNTKLYKIIIFLIENKLISISNQIEKEQWYFLIKGFINEQNQYLQPSLTEEQQTLQIQRYELYMELPKPPKELFWLNLKLKDLLKICNLLSLLNQCINGNEINLFEKNEFKNQDLKLKLKFIIINYFKNAIQPNHQDLSILKPLKFYLSEIDCLHHLDLMECLFNNLEVKEETIGLLNNNHLSMSLKFGCFKYWIQFSKYKYKIIDSLFENNKSEDESFQNILFQHVGKNDTFRKIEFINQISEFIIQNYSKEKFKTNSFTLLYLVIGTDDIEMVKLVQRNLYQKIDFSLEPTPIKIPSDSFFIQKFIKSIEMLDYCFGQFKPQFLNNSLNHCFFKFKSFELFKRFEQLLFSSSTQLPISFNYFNSIQYKDPIQLLKMIGYIVEKSNIYSIGFNIMNYIKIPENIGESKFIEQILPDIQFIICNFSNSFIYNPNEMFTKNYQIIKFLDWVTKERQIDIISNRCTFNFNIKTPIINIGLSGDLKSLESFIHQHSNKFLEPTIHNEFDQDVINFKTDLLLIIQGAAKNGQLKVFEYLFYNYPNLLIKKSKKIKNNQNNSGLLFHFRDFWFVFYNAIQKDNIHIIQFIIDELHYKKPNQFQYYFNEYPLINKFFNKI